jgi:hypothetical protein
MFPTNKPSLSGPDVMQRPLCCMRQLDRRCVSRPYHIETAESFLLSTNRALLMLGLKAGFCPKPGERQGLEMRGNIIY